MIEVLVTIVIISFGMLGIAGMLLRSIDSGRVSNSRTLAVWQANEMADRMRANMAGIREGHYDNMTYTAVTTCASNCLTAKCSSQEQADFDFCIWNAQTQRLMPMGRGDIAISAGGSCATSQFVCSFDISVRWDEGKTGDPANLRTYSLRVEP